VTYDDCGAIQESEPCTNGCASAVGCCTDGTRANGDLCVEVIVDRPPESTELPPELVEQTPESEEPADDIAVAEAGDEVDVESSDATAEEVVRDVEETISTDGHQQQSDMTELPSVKELINDDASVQSDDAGFGDGGGCAMAAGNSRHGPCRLVGLGMLMLMMFLSLYWPRRSFGRARMRFHL